MKTESKLRTIWREYLERSFTITIPVLAILSAFAISGLIILAWGSSPFAAYGALFSGAFGSPAAIATTLQRMTPLIFTGLAVAYGYRGGFFNIGAEGQLYMGAIASVWCAITFPTLPSIVLIPLCVLASAFMGMMWVLLPAYLKSRRGINEVLTTLLMNYIAIQYFEWLVRVDHIQEGITLFGGEIPKWTFINWIGIKDATQPHPKTALLVETSFMPSLKSLFEGKLFTSLFGGTAFYQELLSTPAFGRITLAPFLGLLAVILIYFIMFKTTTGYRSRAVGINPEAARFMGINVKNTLFTTALISGTLAGLAGGMEVLGTQHRMIPNFLVNAGFDGIPVALIGQLHPVGAFLSATFFGALRAGANKMQVITSVPVAVVYIIQSLAIVFAISGTTVDIGSTLKKKRIARETDEKKKLMAVEGEVSNAS
ncbi:MAG: ABC transporter permease [Anaerolineae bacterium]|nr:ABC transporter permease [Anaerolineae bacterium]